MRIQHGRLLDTQGRPQHSRAFLPVLSCVLCICCAPAGLFASDLPAGNRVPARDGSPRSIPGLDSLTSATLYKALDYLEIRPSELGFDKLYAEDDTFRLRIVEELLGDPLRLPGWQRETVEHLRNATKSPSALAHALGSLCEAAADPERSIGPEAMTWPEPLHNAGETHQGGNAAAPGSIRRDLEEAVSDFLADCRRAEGRLEQAFAGITPDERDRLLMLAPAFWGDSRDAEDRRRKGLLHRSLGADADTAGDYTEDPVLDAGAAMDRAALTAAAQIFLDGLMRCANRMSDALGPWIDSPARPAPSGPLSVTSLDGVTGEILGVFETPWGFLILGGPGPNQYDPGILARTAFIFEPGGDDVYRGRAASAVGGLLRPMSAIVDWSGSDFYDSRSEPFALGGALFGLAALVDLSGSDVYLGEDGSCGAGFFGAGLLYDGQGANTFEGRNFCQGAGAFGIGALLADAGDVPPPGPELTEDRNYTAGLVKVPGTGSVPVRHDENDMYRAARYSQGFASTFGAGLLYDSAGNDTYRAGGRYLHAPLLPHDFQSLSQGFSIGFRPRAGGGVGILIDEEGNDFYNAEVYSQGSSYWYSIGLLFDGGGNDRYMATQYSQGAGVHLSIGSLWDRGGDDHYVCKHGVTQGTAHDLGLAWFLDEGGNDFYVVSDGQGVSLTNSTAIFIDAQGDDLYATPGRGQGWSRWARGFTGAAIFLDLEGNDTYPAGGPAADGSAWSPELYAVGIDLDRNVQLPAEVVTEPVLTAEDSTRAVSELFETASIWEVGSARERVRRARAALIARGMESVEYAFSEHLGSRSGLEYRTLEALGNAYPDSVAARILPRLRDPDPQVRRNTAGLLGDMKRVEALEPMAAMLSDGSEEKLWIALIRSLGVIGDGRASASIRPFLGDAQERRRICAVDALKSLRDTASIPLMIELLEDPMLTVRSAASAALISFGAEPVSAIAARLEDSDAGWKQPSGTQQNEVRRSGPECNRMIRVHTLGRIAASLADSTGAADMEARAVARRTLLGELQRFQAGTARLSDTSMRASAAARAAAVEALLSLGDGDTAHLVRLHMENEPHPLVQRTYSRLAGSSRME